MNEKSNPDLNELDGLNSLSQTDLNNSAQMDAKGNESVPSGNGITILMAGGISAFVAIVLMVSALSIYHSFFANKQKVGMVDIASILQISEMVFTDQLSRPGVTDADRAKAYEIVKETGSKVQSSIDEIMKTCGCVLMTKAAVIGGTAVDYTDDVKKELGLDKVDIKALQQRMMDVMTGKVQGVLPGVAPQTAQPTQPSQAQGDPSALNPFKSLLEGNK